MYEELHPDRISRLIADSLSGSLSPQEEEELRRWADESLANRQLFQLLGDAESVREETEQIETHDVQRGWQQVERRFRRRRLLRMTLPLAGIAAAAALFAGIFLPDVWFPTPLPVLVPDALADASAVRLRRSSGEVIAMDTAHRVNLAGAVVESSEEGMKVFSRPQARELAATFSEVTVPIGKTYTVTLTDGTSVMMNADSKLRFPDRFPEKGNREVFLSGEAYFKVKKDSKRPFIVHAANSYVRVTGTEFNVESYEELLMLKTTLIEGGVLMGSATMAGEVALTPGMQATLDKSSGDVVTSMVDVGEYTAWMEGLFAFKERPLEQIMKTVARWYGCRVVWERAANDRVRFTGKIARSSTLAEVAGYFSNTGEVMVTERNGALIIH